VPSTLRWTDNGSKLSLTQEGDYPYEDHVTFTVTNSKATDLTLNFRIPVWAEGASISVNGKRQAALAEPGHFAAIRREWKSGDRVELEFPLKMRLEAIDAQHADTVALLRGPLVLMAVKQQQEAPLPKVTREQLLSATRISERQWQVSSTGVPVTMLPFTSLGGQSYTTYLQVVRS
jgi:hypothetical protein